MSNVIFLFIPHNVTSHAQPLDAGIITSKAWYRKLHIRGMDQELESKRVVTAAGTRPDMKLAIKWVCGRVAGSETYYY